MSAADRKPASDTEGSVLDSALALQQEGLRLLLAEVRALQAMIPAGEQDLPRGEDIEKGFDNMPV